MKYYSDYNIKNEDDMVIFLVNILKKPFNSVYPKVSIISRNIKVSPDIDILVINNDRTIGYETKYIKFHSSQKRYIYESIYKGIGQALLYINYGIDEVYLTIAYENNNEITYDKKKKIEKKINDIIQSMHSLRINNYLGLEVIEIYPKYFTYRQIIKPSFKEEYEENETDFSKGLKLGMKLVTLPDSHKFAKQCLLKHEFSYNEKMSEQIISISEYDKPHIEFIN